MRIKILLLPVLAIACASATNATRTPKRNIERLEAAEAVGPAVSCVEINRINHTRVLNDRTIDFEMIGKQTYRNTLPYNCPGLGFEESFSYKTSIARLCSVDTITVLERAGGIRRGASCGLGEFQPVSFPKK